MDIMDLSDQEAGQLFKSFFEGVKENSEPGHPEELLVAISFLITVAETKESDNISISIDGVSKKDEISPGWDVQITRKEKLIH